MHAADEGAPGTGPDPGARSGVGTGGAPGGGRVLVEICVDSLAGARVAAAAGADRIELSSALVDGGLTPGIGLVRRVCAEVRLPVHVLVRPRGGDFVLDDDDLETMGEDLRALRAAGAAGVVVGALTPGGDVDRPRTERLVAAARPLEVTFHRALDHARDPLDALATLRSIGVDRVLTSGAAATALEGSALLARLVELARGRPAVMAGGGVIAAEAAALVRRTGVRELHASASGRVPSPARAGSDHVRLGTSDPAYRRVTDAAAVRALVEAARSL